MESLGINFGFLFVQSIIPILWFVFTVICFVDLGKKNIGGTALAYCIIRPTAESRV